MAVSAFEEKMHELLRLGVSVSLYHLNMPQLSKEQQAAT